MRASTDHQRAALKSATGRAIRAAGGPGALAEDTRVNGSMLSRYEAREADGGEKYMPIDVALDADIAAGSPIIVGAMAAILGYRLERSNAQTEVPPASLSDFVALTKRQARMTETFAEALDDGRIDAAERRQLTGLIDAELAALTALATRIGGAA